MELTNEFTVAVPVAQAWGVLTDVERIAPCMPGAQLQEVEGDEYRGVVKVKVGPITAQYKGVASFVEQDDVAHRAVLRAEGRDTRGQGTAKAVITASLAADGDGTRVTVVTDLTVTGRVAQLGRGVMADVSAKLMDQFAACLQTDVLAAAPAVEFSATPEGAPAPPGDADAPAPPGGAGTAGPRPVDQPESVPIDLLGVAGTPMVKRVGPILGVAVVVLWLLRQRRRRHR